MNAPTIARVCLDDQRLHYYPEADALNPRAGHIEALCHADHPRSHILADPANQPIAMCVGCLARLPVSS